MYDFNRCKLCGKNSATVKYQLKQMALYACASCDFHYIDVLDDLLAEQPEGSLLTERARTFIESKLPQNSIQHKKNLQFVQAYVAPAGKHCLDIGCGAGLFPSLLQQTGAVARGIEPQQIFREFSLEKFQLSINHQLIDDHYWQKSYAEYFDVVTLWDTLEHVNFPVETLTAACRLIKPGGHLFLDTPSRDSFFYRVSEWAYRLSRGSKPLLLNSLYSAKPYGHKQIFTTAQLTALVENSGVTIVGRSSFHRSRNKLVIVCRKNRA